MPGSFLDTNVLVYLAKSEPRKAQRVEELLSQGPTISIQVLNELANVLRRKASFSWGETDAFLSTVRSLAAVAPLTLETHELGLSFAERYGLSIYDSMIMAAAVLADCDLVWSEDMQDGLEIDKRLRISNPFRR
jgi:predicted nucleic acid-binding protein